MDNEDIIALLEAHESIIMEREEGREMMDNSEFKRGHINGLNEARNRVEECILRRVEYHTVE